jgi:hypothetical protein
MKLWITFTLLILAAVIPVQTWAECAWVLWEHRVSLGRQGVVFDDWSVLDTYDSRTACREVYTRLMSGDTAWSNYLMGYMPPATPEEKSKWTPAMRQEMERHEQRGGRTERLKLEKTPNEGGFIVNLYDRDGTRFSSETKTAQCLPDTIDPRGPKGGGR